jgi:hypothetical protein
MLLPTNDARINNNFFTQHNYNPKTKPDEDKRRHGPQLYNNLINNIKKHFSNRFSISDLDENNMYYSMQLHAIPPNFPHHQFPK